jgi:hypothetical protein
LSTTRQNTVTTFGFVDKNNAPLQSPTQSYLTDIHHSGEINEKISNLFRNSIRIVRVHFLCLVSSYVHEKFSLSTSFMYQSGGFMQQQ